MRAGTWVSKSQPLLVLVFWKEAIYKAQMGLPSITHTHTAVEDEKEEEGLCCSQTINVAIFNGEMRSLECSFPSQAIQSFSRPHLQKDNKMTAIKNTLRTLCFFGILLTIT